MKAISILIIVVLLINFPCFSQEMSAQNIIDKVNELMNQKSVYSLMTMTITTSSGELRTFEYESWSKNGGEKNLMRYTKPARIKGQAMLLLNHADDIWAYFPRTKRVRKLATHAKKQKMQGSDFTYEDMGSGDAFIKKFTSRRLPDEKMEDQDCYKIELIRKENADSHYSRLIMWVIQDNFYPVVIDYFDEDDPTLWLKRMVQSDIREIDGVPTAMKMVMFNKTDNTQTSMEILSCEYNKPLNDSMFSERELKK